MKKITFLLALAVFAAMLFACGKKDASTPPGDATIGSPAGYETEEDISYDGSEAFEDTRKTVKDNKALIGVSYLGVHNDYSEELISFMNRQKYWEDLLFLMEIPAENMVQKSGEEVYVVVPVEGATVTVYEWVADKDASANLFKKGEMLFSTEKGDPFFLQGNSLGEKAPSFLIVAQKDGKTVEYNPFINTKEGKLNVAEGVCDITPYGSMTDFLSPQA